MFSKYLKSNKGKVILFESSDLTVGGIARGKSFRNEQAFGY
jgi:hypothetical protein